MIRQAIKIMLNDFYPTKENVMLSLATLTKNVILLA